MKVLFIVYGSGGLVSGGYLYDSIVADHLRSGGDEVETLEIKRMPKLLPAVFRRGKAILHALSSGSYDCIVVDELVHLDAAPPIARFLSKHPSEQNRPKIVVLVHMLSGSVTKSRLFTRIHRTYESMLLSSADLVIANSVTASRTIEDMYSPGVPTAVCPPGKNAPGQPELNTERIFSIRRKADTARVDLLANGNVLPGKGYHVLLDALARIESLPWNLTIVGDTDIDPAYVRRLRKRIEHLRLERRVTFTGSIPVEKLYHFYMTSDVFVFPSLYESYGIALAEALSFGLPVVAFDVGAIGEVASSASRIGEFGETSPTGRWSHAGGFLVAAGSAELFAYAVSLLVSDRILRESMSAVAFQNGRDLPTWDDTTRRFRDLLHDLIPDGAR